MTIKREKLRKYETPKLKAFGSVRNLTGGSAGMASDGRLGMTMM